MSWDREEDYRQQIGELRDRLFEERQERELQQTIQPQSSEELATGEGQHARRPLSSRILEWGERSMIPVAEQLLSEADYADKHYDEGVGTGTAREAAKLLETLYTDARAFLEAWGNGGDDVVLAPLAIQLGRSIRKIEGEQ